MLILSKGERPRNMPQFNRYIGIDYSGAVTPESSCKGLRVYVAEGTGTPEQIQPPSSPRRHWTRRGLAAEYNQIGHPLQSNAGMAYKVMQPPKQ